MKRVHVDKIASVVQGLQLGRRVVLGDEIPARAGTVVAGRVKNAKVTYNTLENTAGRMVIVRPGDVVVGALGHRDALHGYSGHVPKSVRPGDSLQILNLGGVLGEGAIATPGRGAPFELEVLGSVLRFPRDDRSGGGLPANIEDVSLVPNEPPRSFWSELPPVVALVGTSMNAGKTTAACALVSAMNETGRHVAAGKLTGVSLRRDVLEMADCGAEPTAVFTDFGVVTTNEENAARTARALLHHLVTSTPTLPDVIVLELGDGLLGTYGVRAILADEDLSAVLRSERGHVLLCANDPVGLWGANELLRDRFELTPDLVTGPVTDSQTGRNFARENLDLPSWNALTESFDPLWLERGVPTLTSTS